MAYSTDDAELGSLRLDFDRSVKVEFRGAYIIHLELEWLCDHPSVPSADAEAVQ